MEDATATVTIDPRMKAIIYTMFLSQRIAQGRHIQGRFTDEEWVMEKREMREGGAGHLQPFISACKVNSTNSLSKQLLSHAIIISLLL